MDIQWKAFLSEIEDELTDADRGDLTWGQLYKGIQFNSRLKGEVAAITAMCVSQLNRHLTCYGVMDIKKIYDGSIILGWVRRILCNSSAYVSTSAIDRFIRTRMIEYIIVYGLSRISIYCNGECNRSANSLIIANGIVRTICYAVGKITTFRTVGHRMCFRKALLTCLRHLLCLCEGCDKRYMDWVELPLI